LSAQIVAPTARNEVRREMSAVYRQVWRRQMASDEGSRRSFSLAQIGKVLEVCELEQRIEDLESARGIAR
jgi:hypothetical protein